MCKIAGVVILFNPQNDVYNHIMTYCSDLDTLFVIDNSEKEFSIVKKIEKILNVIYIKNEENMGISYSLNLALKLSKNKYQYLLTMDQDSFFKTGEFSKYLNEAMPCFKEDILITSPYLEGEKNFIKGYSANVKQIASCITSGSIVDINKAILIGGWDEKMFIDEVDNEFCYRGEEHGLKTLCIINITLQHKLGNPERHTILGIKEYKATNHNYIRQYYIMRNRLYNMNKHPKHRAFLIKASVKWLIKILIAEKDKKRKLNSMYEGIKDYYSNRMGKKNFK